MKETYRDDKAACSTLAVSLKRWDVEVGTDKRAQQRNKGMAENRTNVCSLNPLYKIEEDDWNFCFHKSWGMNNPAIFSLKILNGSKNVDDSVLSWTVDLPLITLLVWGMAFRQ